MNLYPGFQGGVVALLAVLVGACGYEAREADNGGVIARGQAQPTSARKVAIATDEVGTERNVLASSPPTKEQGVSAVVGSIVGATASPERDLCEGLVTHNERVAVKPVAKPPFMKRYRDPAFGTTVIRVTDSRPNAIQKPAYSSVH